jgi:histidinol-phosphatase (PHP family)
MWMMKLKPADNHVHTQWSWDTSLEASMERCCERAVALGIPSIAFTEHVDFNTWGDGDGGDHASVTIATRLYAQRLDVEGYLANVERCRDRFPDLRILTGIEAGEPHLFAGSVAGVLASAPFERVLGSLHSVVEGGRLVAADSLFGELPAVDVMRRYLGELLRLVKGSDAFEVLAHADFPRRYWPAGEGPYDEALFEDEYRAVFRELAASERALEMNTRSPMWSVALLSWWRDEGGRAVSFGSDAHLPLRVGALFDEAVDVVEAAGFRPGRDRHDFWRR